MYFDIPKEQASIIKVIGVGGGGSNAVNHMFLQGIKDVNFVICNTDQQALEMSPVPNKVQLGPSLTKGRGAGSHPTVGQQATMESLQEIKSILEKNTEMVFITAGMGGGTGTGGAPVIAKLAKDMGILTIGIVTVPFGFEGKRRKSQAFEGLETLKHYVDAILVISNDKLREMFGNLAWNEAFSQADDVLATAAKGIAEIITVPGYVNVDFEDVKTVLRGSGLAIMGSGKAAGQDRALEAVRVALESPLLNDNDIRGARSILLNITSGTTPVLMDEIAEITEFVQEAAGNDCDIIWGNCNDESLGESIMVTLIATGFETVEQRNQRIKQTTVKVTHVNTHELLQKKVTPIEEPIAEVKEPEAEPEAVITLKHEPKEDKKAKKEEVKETKEVKEQNPSQFSFDFGLFANTIQEKPVINEVPPVVEPPVAKIEEVSFEEKEELVIELKKQDPITKIISEQEEETAEEEVMSPVEMHLRPSVIIEPVNEFEEPVAEEEALDMPMMNEVEEETIFEIKTNIRHEAIEPEAEIEEEQIMIRKEEQRVSQKQEGRSFITNDDKINVVNSTGNDRINRLKSMSMKLSGNTLDEVEKVPAFMRRNIELEDTPNAREINVSKYNIVEGEDGPELKKNNSFLHDNVD
ncbi:MAG TPA: cell division protein FtsZ [Chitinophagales bacterium]|nr:cell division protein FtsZ [Chitinophagales bacterium]